MSSRYVQLPNGSYLEWPEGVSAEQFKAKATKLGAAPKASEPNPNDRLWSGTQSFSAYHPKTGLAGIEEKLGDFRNRLSELANRGAGSYKVGTTSDVGDFMASAPLGALRAAKGVSELPQGKIWEGTKDVVGGGMQAATMPAMFMAPEATGAAKNLLPSTEKAGKLIEGVEQVAGHVPIDVKDPGAAALKVQEMAQSGGTMPKIIRDFMNRVTKPGSPPMTFKEARQFYENATRISFDEMQRLNPKAKYLLTKFTKALDQSIQDAADTVGQRGAYAKAMRAYRNAARFRDFKEAIPPRATKLAEKAAQAAAMGAGAGAGYKIYETLK